MTFEIYNGSRLLDFREISGFINELAEKTLKKEKILLLPPDISRYSSGAGIIAQRLYESDAGNNIKKIIPATGTHNPMTPAEKRAMFGSIPESLFDQHNWKSGLTYAGTVPESFVMEKAALSYSIPVWINNEIFSRSYSVIVSAGQVVPHEIAGMANHNKNIIIGTGGSDIINLSHYIGAVYGMERIMGQAETPVREIFDYAENHFLKDIKVLYILTVCGSDSEGRHGIKGIFAGYGKDCFKKACAASEKENITRIGRKPSKVIVTLDSKIKSLWIGNKAIYRSRLAIADGGELIIIAPEVKAFGEDKTLDIMIRKYGYVGKDIITEAVRKNSDLRENLSAAAHLIHGSSEGRFKITWAPGGIQEADIRSVGYDYAQPAEMTEKYDPASLVKGFNTIKGEEIYYISDPGQGLWTG